MISALFVHKNGVYFNRPDVDPWDIERNAMLYDGPNRVVAHPPCARWCQLAAVVEKRWGHKRGDDGGCFVSALASVRKYGGVLEHPALSLAWKTFDLQRPEGAGWWSSRPGEWSCEVWQSAYGHQARKKTWLLYCGPRPAPMNWERRAGTHQIGWFDRIKPTLSKKAASASPPLFVEALIGLASGRPGLLSRSASPGEAGST